MGCVQSAPNPTEPKVSTSVNISNIINRQPSFHPKRILTNSPKTQSSKSDTKTPNTNSNELIITKSNTLKFDHIKNTLPDQLKNHANSIVLLSKFWKENVSVLIYDQNKLGEYQLLCILFYMNLFKVKFEFDIFKRAKNVLFSKLVFKTHFHCV